MMECETFCGSGKSACMSSLFCVFMLIAFGTIGIAFYINIAYFGAISNWQLYLIFAGIAIVAVIFFVLAICMCRSIIRRKRSFYS